MMLLVIGSNGSGKSEYAENWLCSRCAEEKYYIATMLPYGEEGAARVEKHRKMRAGKGFITLEAAFDFAKLSLKKNAMILLEDASNLLANILFEQKGSLEDAKRDIDIVRKKAAILVVVSIGNLREEAEYDAETLNYLRNLHALNEWLTKIADEVKLC